MTRAFVPIAILKRQSVSTGLINLLGTLDVAALGYLILSEQTAPDHIRCQYEERVGNIFEGITAEFRQAGGEVDYRLVFTNGLLPTVQRDADETDSQAFTISGTTGPIKRLPVFPSGERATEPFRRSLI